jgi:hypothetical protein
VDCNTPFASLGLDSVGAAAVALNLERVIGYHHGQCVTHLETPIEPLALADGALDITIGPQRIDTLALRPRP